MKKSSKIKNLEKIPFLENRVCKSLKIDRKANSFCLEDMLSGYNSNVYIFSIKDSKKSLTSKVCVKIPISKKNRLGTVIEILILKAFSKNGLPCPKLIASSVGSFLRRPYIVMDFKSGVSWKNYPVTYNTAESIFKMIKKQKMILAEKSTSCRFPKKLKNLQQKIDFEKKILELCSKTPSIEIDQAALSFLNPILNSELALSGRELVTDRTSENILIDSNQKVHFIDFSTVRIGTEFDNYIQFIDDPRLSFSFEKPLLIDQLVEGENKCEKLNLFFVASIYTNLLQGLYIFGPNKDLGGKYLDKANAAYQNIKKGTLIYYSY